MADEKTHTKADIDAAVTAAVAKVQEAVDTLTSKNEGLLDDLKKAQREARAAKDIKPEDLAAAEDRADKAEAKAKALEASVKTLTAERDKTAKSLETEQGATRKLLAQDGLKTALIANGVKDEDFIDSLTAKFLGGVTIVTEGDTRKAMFGDKVLADHIKEWATSDAGKKFVEAAVNTGGGAGGGDKSRASAKTMTRTAYNALGQQEQGEIGLQTSKGEIEIVDEAA